MSSSTLHRTDPAARGDATGAQLTFGPALNAPRVVPRTDAELDPDVVRVREDAAVKFNALPSRSGHPSGMSSVETHLHVEVWLKNLTYAKHVWVDVHVLDEIGTVLHAETLTLRYERPAGDGGDLFVLDQVLYRGSVATEGSVDARPDARTVEYRVYGEMGGRVYTDGSDHRCDLRADSVSR